MSAEFVQVAPDSTGKKIQTFENDVEGETVEAQAVVLVGTDGTAGATTTQSLSLHMSDTDIDPGSLSITFWTSEDFEGTIQGGTFPANASITFDAPVGRTLGGFSLTVAAGTISIANVV